MSNKLNNKLKISLRTLNPFLLDLTLFPLGHHILIPAKRTLRLQYLQFMCPLEMSLQRVLSSKPPSAQGAREGSLRLRKMRQDVFPQTFSVDKRPRTNGAAEGSFPSMDDAVFLKVARGAEDFVARGTCKPVRNGQKVMFFGGPRIYLFALPFFFHPPW